MLDEKLGNDFDLCATLYQDYIRQTSKAKTNATVDISELKTGGKRKLDAIEDRYYTKEEYTSCLTPDQKKVLASKRLKRGHKPSAKDSKVKGAKAKSDKKDVMKNIKAVVNRQVSQLAKQMGKAAVADVDDDSSTHSGSTTETKATPGSNRTNPNLSRQKKVTIDKSAK